MRAALGTGAAIGYVLGARAGKQRYEQIRRAFQAISRSKPAKQINAEVRGVTRKVGQRVEAKAANTVSKVGGRLRGRSSRSNGAGNSHVRVMSVTSTKGLV
jgi:hypothetical protein